MNNIVTDLPKIKKMIELYPGSHLNLQQNLPKIICRKHQLKIGKLLQLLIITIVRTSMYEKILNCVGKILYQALYHKPMNFHQIDPSPSQIIMFTILITKP
jgi:hypothetical protein